jgi:hypothetical protein
MSFGSDKVVNQSLKTVVAALSVKIYEDFEYKRAIANPSVKVVRILLGG